MAIRMMLIPCMFAAMMHGGGKTPGKSGIFIDGKVSVELGEASKGGSTADPEAGNSFRLNLMTPQEKTSGWMMFSPRFDDGRTAVFITGFRRKGVSYTQAGGFVERIILKRPQQITVDLDEGVYDGMNPDVKSVEFRRFDIGPDYARILIEIKKTDGRTLTIAYDGAAGYDGLY